MYSYCSALLSEPQLFNSMQRQTRENTISIATQWLTLNAKCGLEFKELSFCKNWPARPGSLQRKCNNLREHSHDSPSHFSGVYIILEVCLFEGVVELVLPNAWSGQPVLSNRWKASSVSATVPINRVGHATH